ncbi:hypothetical protein RQM47_13805 [Rubrivirga sp. S365]|uniref:S8 family serine peptidase n=1 Tax=Rubrivirga sp. S365 TaxID=3076080 RepID=UPI0028C91FA2|nr:S8 family serine peptidase [Rubrivirga sp. S365]MDT7857722.1 hypothetical protein [Rubrivirga sp. S365]
MRRAPRLLPALLACVGLACLGGAAAAQAPASKYGPLARLDGGLQAAAAAHARGEAARVPGGIVAGGLVVVDVAAADGDGAALRTRLEALGLEGGAAYGAVVSGKIPVAALDELAVLDGVRSARAVRGVTHGRRTGRGGAARPAASPVFVGAVDGEAARALRVLAARQALGVDGSGIRVGVMSDSYNACAEPGRPEDADACRTTAADDVATNDLPTVAACPAGAGSRSPVGACVLREGPPGGSDEGRAMMQLARDVAPGLSFSFHTAFLGQAAFARGILDLAAAGADVVVDDVLLFAEPFFQDGLVARAVTEVVAGGVAYVSSAGNQADDAYLDDFDDTGAEAAFTSTGPDGQTVGPFDGALHDFDPGPGVDAFQDVTLEPGESLTLVFQYAEPSFSASDGRAGATSDYDVYLVDAARPDAEIVAASASNNSIEPVVLDDGTTVTGSGEPVEIVEYANETDGPQTLYLAVVKFSGADRFFKYIEFDGQAEFEYRQSGNATSVAHNNAAAALSVAAAAWFNTSAFNESLRTAGVPAVLNPFTSFGGSLILFDDDGTRLATPQNRMKPDVTGSDGDNNTFFGFDLPESLDADTAPNFFGTSAAAPNVAAVAALMLAAAGGPRSLAPADVYRLLEETAADVTPSAASSGTLNVGTGPGYDPRSGVGFVRGDRALAAAAELGVGELVEDGPFRLRGPFPNPVRDRLRLVFLVDVDQDVSVALYDMRGRRVATAFEGRVGAGQTRSVELDVTGLAAAPYLLHLAGDEAALTRVITVL